MHITGHKEAVPLRANADGVILVGQTRVPLETVIHAFDRGDSPEEIVMQFPVLALADVYLVIGYYLNHRAEVEAYVKEADAEADQVQREYEARFDTAGLRERLLARKKRQE